MTGSSISFEERLAKPQRVLIQELDDESVLLHVANGQYFGLNVTGTKMWNELTTASSIQAAYNKLLSQYNIPPDQLKEDLSALIEELLDNELLERAGR